MSKINFGSKFDLDYRKPVKVIRNAPNEEIAVEIEFALKWTFYLLLLFDNFSLLVKKPTCGREPDFVNFAVFAPIENCQLFKNAIYDPKAGAMDNVV